MLDGQKSLSESHRSVSIPRSGGWFKKFLAFAGPGYLVAVGYMDPGNWATDIAGGSAFGYSLLSVIVLSNLMAILLQILSGKLGIVTGMDLAQACRAHFSKKINVVLWALCELAIAACDLAEVIGAAIALKLLFGIPILWGVVITVLDVFLIMLLQKKGFRYLEALVLALMVTIGACFAAELFFSKPVLVDVAKGILPTSDILTNPNMLYIAIGILGATVMPHNLYLQSSIVQTRAFDLTPKGKRQALRYTSWDTTIALFFALFINASILIVASATFFKSGMHDIADIEDAYHLLAPLLGLTIASVLFGVALLLSGQNSTLTGTLAGQIVMEGFLNLKMRPWLRRIITRLLAVIPAVIVISIMGESSVTQMLILSQVILSLQLPFAVIPLVIFTSSKKLMGEFANRFWLKMLSWFVAGVICVLNVFLLYQTISRWF
jgi:manganese transport protein